ncbi:MAG: methyl-accepting chemotaxis protein [Muribaculum sp.]|nr:methyl-accepting chemotaxis protein [Muribaculum sp.]
MKDAKSTQTEQKNRGLSIQLKILLPVNALILIICMVLGFSAYRKINDGMVSLGVEEARMAAMMVTDTIDGDTISRLAPGCEQTQEYQSLLTSLRAIQERFGIAYLYTLYTDGRQVYYGVDTDRSELQAAVGKPYETSYADLADTFAGEEYVEDYIDHTEYGDLISVYMPISDSSGQIVGVLGCDYDASGVMERLNTLTGQLLLVTIICIVCSVVLLHILVGRILRNLRLVDRKIYDLVHSEGDLTQKLDIATGDELELISDNVNALLEHIREIMLSISRNSSRLNESSRTIAQNLSKVELNISDVSAAMEEMSASMEETSATMNQIDANAVDIYETMERISNSADAGRTSSGEIMRKAAEIHQNAVTAQNEAKLQAQEMSAAVNDKIEKSKAVQEISLLTENIITITEETNLLALNASIEAARAGEAGRGFAVVADEIGKLAANSSDTAVQIQQVSATVIEAVNELAEHAEQMIRFMDETAMSGYQKLLDTSDSYQDDVKNMNDMMQTFASDSRLVNTSVDRIKEAISAVNIAVSEIATTVVNVTETAVDLSGSMKDIGGQANTNTAIAGQLDDEVNKFKLE